MTKTNRHPARARSRARAVFALLALSAVAACAPRGQPLPPDPALERAIAGVGPGWPVSVSDFRTTSGDIYAGNLDGQIRALVESIDRAPDPARKAQLARLFYHRFQLLGRLEDALRARLLIAEVARAADADPETLLLQAAIEGGFHDFDAAQAAINRAVLAGADQAQVARAQVAVNRALGDEGADDAPLPDPEDYVALVGAAAHAVERGRPDEASTRLRSAQAAYRDVSPFPLAWIHLQQGIVFLRHGALEPARVFFSAAHRRLPQYYLATEHLAEVELGLGNAERAAELYRAVIAQNDHPAFWHGLALAEAELGNRTAAADAARAADEKYDALLASQPLMFADHAVDYYIDTARPERALELALLNAQHRRDVNARVTLASALMANGQDIDACTEVSALRADGYAPPEITVRGEPLAACGQDD